MFFLLFVRSPCPGSMKACIKRGGSNEYPQSMVLSRNKKIMYTPVNPASFTIKKWGLSGSTLYRYVFVMNSRLSRYIFLQKKTFSSKI